MNDDQGLDVFTLTVYDMAIFPRVTRYIKVAVVDFFEQIQNHCNSSSTILVETIRSLNFCRQNIESRFVGYLPMLYIWLRSHLLFKKSAFMKPYFPNSLPIEEFCNSEWSGLRTKEQWVAFLERISSEQLSCPNPEWSTRGNCHVPLSGFQFFETQSKTRKASGNLARLKNGNPT